MSDTDYWQVEENFSKISKQKPGEPLSGMLSGAKEQVSPVLLKCDHGTGHAVKIILILRRSDLDFVGTGSDLYYTRAELYHKERIHVTACLIPAHENSAHGTVSAILKITVCIDETLVQKEYHKQVKDEKEYAYKKPYAGTS